MSSPQGPAVPADLEPAGLDPVGSESARRRAIEVLAPIRPTLDRLGELFATAGHQLYLVGGPVRDVILGGLGQDLDFTTSARPDEIERLLRTVSTQVWTVGKAWGTIGCRLDAVAGPAQNALEQPADWLVEVTTFRSDVYRSDSRKPEVTFGDTLEGDLVRRDFTVNAMALSLPGLELIDPNGGLRDLALARLRTPGTAEQSFSDDPLRMMRAARFAARLQFAPTPDVIRAMTEMAARLSIVSAERIRDELSKLLLTDQPRVGLDLLVRTGLADVFLPELGALRLERDEHHRHKDVYAHSLTVLDQAIALERSRGHLAVEGPDLVNRLAALLHDIGKPKTRKFEPGGKVSFHHHDVVGAKLVRKRLTALRYPSDVVDAVAELVALHLRFHGYGDLSGGEQEWTDSAVRRYVRDAGPQLERLHMLTRADCTTRNQAKASRLSAAYDELEQRIGVLAEAEELDSMRPDLDGNQIMAVLGVPPGRQVGQAYKFLLELRIDQGPQGVERAAEALRAWWAEQPH